MFLIVAKLGIDLINICKVYKL